TGGRTGRGSGRTEEPTSRVGGQTGDQDGQRGDQGIRTNGGDDKVPDFSTIIVQQLQDLLPTTIAQVCNHDSNIQGDVRGVNMGNGRSGCSYKEFMACNPKDYNGKGGAIVYTFWIKKMESVQDMSGCRANEKVKYTAGSFSGKALTWWNTQVQTRGREAAVGMTWENFKDLMRKDLYPNNEMQKLETDGEFSRKENVKDDNKRSRTGKVFAIITNPVRKEYMGHFSRDCMAGPRMVTPVKPSIKTRRDSQNQPMAIEGGQGRGNNDNQARGGAFIMGAEEARHDPNIMMCLFTLNNHYATTLFDSGADYSFVSTTFIPLLDIEPSDLGFSYKIEIAGGQLIEERPEEKVRYLMSVKTEE
ncbi:reverse transcriptase domain-containing protein, partial [Tanacetum coccineum]